MRVAVGSTNPVKRGATEDAFAAVAGATVESVPVDSGVSEQPRGHEETIEGARTRARAALTAGSPASGVSSEPRSESAYDLGVGIEGGVAGFDGTEGLYLIMWAAIGDGSRTELGAGPSIRLPADVAERVRAGEELGPVMDDAFDLEHVKENQGAAGVLTGNIVDRRGALADAVAGALGPFVTDAYD
jgi:inosine/xanthosine triphosphatase